MPPPVGQAALGTRTVPLPEVIQRDDPCTFFLDFDLTDGMASARRVVRLGGVSGPHSVTLVNQLNYLLLG